jgi:hypothetical protein
VFDAKMMRMIKGMSRQFQLVVPLIGFLLVVVGFTELDVHWQIVGALRLLMMLSAMIALYSLFVTWRATRLELTHFHT